MNAQIPPHFPTPLLAICLLVLVLFGIGFNKFTHWIETRRVWPVSLTVAIGVSVTMLVPTVMFLNLQLFFWQSSLVYLISFTASGGPMIWGNVHRHVNRMHKARPLSNRVMRVRDEVVMDLSAMAEEIVQNEAQVAKVVHRIHKNIGSLKSL